MMFIQQTGNCPLKIIGFTDSDTPPPSTHYNAEEQTKPQQAAIVSVPP